jgi:hypothetical protein
VVLVLKRFFESRLVPDPFPIQSTSKGFFGVRKVLYLSSNSSSHPSILIKKTKFFIFKLKVCSCWALKWFFWNTLKENLKKVLEYPFENLLNPSVRKVF